MLDPIALVPTRGLKTSMTRLRSDLPDIKVNQLVEALLSHTIDILNNFDLNIIIITADKSISLQYENINFVFDTGDDLNKAIIDAMKQYTSDRYFLVMPDLPGLSVNNINTILHLSKLHPYVICPTEDDGTAAGIFPKELLHKRFLGPKSSAKFIEYANNNKISLSKIKIDELKIDLDDIDDYSTWENRIINDILDN